MTPNQIKKIIDSLTLDEKIGQLLCYSLTPHDTVEEKEEFFARIHGGSFFISYGMTPEQVEGFRNMMQKYTPIPMIVSADLENGPRCALIDTPDLPLPMAWGAADDEALLQEAGVCTGKIARARGVQWTFAPTVDINYNPNNPEVNGRGISDSPAQVLKMATAYMRGCQTDGNLLAGAKHFPGGGMDDRNQHFCTTVNPMSRSKYKQTYEKIYKRMIKEGCASIMVAHIALPCIDGEGDALGAIPATLSEKLKMDLIKKEWKFDGVLVSDAMSMIGSCARCDIEDLAVEFIRTGGDIVLFPEKSDFDRLKAAVLDGRITNERLEDALTRILRMKDRAGLFHPAEMPPVDVEEESRKLAAISEKLADKSIKIVRDLDHILPLDRNEVKRVLLINIYSTSGRGRELTTAIEDQLHAYGIETETMDNAPHYVLEQKVKEVDAVIVASYYGGNCPKGIHGGSNRTGWDAMMTFWRGYIFKARRLVFLSCGDPYKLYEFPYLRTYVNTHSNEAVSLRSAVKLLFGEIPHLAKNPVTLKGFFDREV